MYNRRNPYRRPSALGVPSNHQWQNSEYEYEYDEKTGERFLVTKHKDNLQYDGLNFAENTTNNAIYTAKDGRRATKAVPGDHLKQDGQLEKDTETGSLIINLRRYMFICNKESSSDLKCYMTS